MMCSLEQSSRGRFLLLRRPSRPPPLPPISVSTSAAGKPHLKLTFHLSSFSTTTTKHFLSNVKPGWHRRGIFECSSAHEEEDSSPGESSSSFKEKLMAYFCLGYGDRADAIFQYLFVTAASTGLYNVACKNFLDLSPYPWLLSAASLTAASLCMLTNWATGAQRPPDTNLDFWMSLFPVAVTHTIGHVATMVSLSKLPLPLTHTLRCAEPVFSILLSLLLGESFPLRVYIFALPIITGCSLAGIVAKDFSNFNMTGFVAAMIANLAFASRNIISDRGIQKNKGKEVRGPNYYACLSMMSLLILTPFGLAIEGPRIWAAGSQMVTTLINTRLEFFLVAQGLMYHVYNEEAYQFFPDMHPFLFLIVNPMKKISVIAHSIIMLHTSIDFYSAFGAFSAILGIYGYSLELCHNCRTKSWFL